MTSLAAEPLLQQQLQRAMDAPRWWLGFSGGLDSTVLLHLLQRFRDAHPAAPPLEAVHIHHGMHPDADLWQAQCRAQCEQLGLPFLARRVEVRERGGGPEQAAREARHAEFERLLAPGEIVFLAHHRDDQVETFFLRLMRGAGLEGLAAMAASRPLGSGSLRRPMLHLPRDALLQWAREQELRWIEDPSNADTSLDRNFLRQEVLPLLAGRWPGMGATVSRAASRLAAASQELAELSDAPRRVIGAMGDPGIALPPQPHSAAFGRALRQWLREQGLQAPPAARLEELLRQLSDPSGAGRARLEWGGRALQHYRGALYLLPQGGELAAQQTLAPGGVLAPGDGRRWHLERASQGLLLEEGEQLAVRWRAGGERCRPAGREGSASLKKLLQEAAVPPWWRDRLPLFYLGEELLAVGDLWLCESARLAAPGGGGWRPRRAPADADGNAAD